MSVVRWQLEQATAPVDPLALDEVAGEVLVLEGVTSGDDPDLGWVRRAPCVVVGIAPVGEGRSAAVDVAVGADEGDVVDALAGAVSARPHAARTLVDVLRTVAGLDVAGGLTVESLAYSALLAGPEFESWLASQPVRSRRSFEGEPVRVARDGDDLRITLDRPANRNAFSAEMRDALFEALSVALVDPSIARVVLDAEGPVFSSGGDLTEFGTAADVVRAHEVRTQRSAGALLDQLGDRVEVRVHGTCVGAGVELPAFARRVVARADTSFRLPEVGMGLIPGAGGTVSLTRRIGRQRAARLALLGEPIDVREALAIGLVDAVD